VLALSQPTLALFQLVLALSQPTLALFQLALALSQPTLALSQPALALSQPALVPGSGKQSCPSYKYAPVQMASGPGALPFL
jgi:hypothetical protein